MTKFIKKLPPILQTPVEKKFFDATFDQVFTKKDSETLQGFVGRRNTGKYNPATDFYLPEPTKNRTQWQLEPTSFAREEDTTKSNVFFYDDLLNRIDYFGGNTSNQNRLFESEYYSWAPPIDFDMFTNYQNYYWISDGITPISLYGVTRDDIIGHTTYTYRFPGWTSGQPELVLSTGMRIILEDDITYTHKNPATPAQTRLPHALTVENVGDVGNAGGIRLIEWNLFTYNRSLRHIPWSGIITLADGSTINNNKWDFLPWDSEAHPDNIDYITIERGSVNKNAWSRANKWVHKDTINAVILFLYETRPELEMKFPDNAKRALRPIIQFSADCVLYNSGTLFNTEIHYGFTVDSSHYPIYYKDYNGLSLDEINHRLLTDLHEGDLVAFFNDDTPFNFWDNNGIQPWDDSGTDPWDDGISVVNVNIFRTSISDTGVVTFMLNFTVDMIENGIPGFIEYDTLLPIENGDIVFITKSGATPGPLQGETWYYNAGTWQEVNNEKSSANQPPLFQLYDHAGIALDDEATYPNSTFAGSKIFSYKVNNNIAGAYVDPVLGFPLVYTALGLSSDIIFQNNLITDRYVYGETQRRLPINGYYHYMIDDDPTLYNMWDLYTTNSQPGSGNNTAGCQ